MIYIFIDLPHPNVYTDSLHFSWFVKMIGMYKLWGDHGEEVAFANILSNPNDIIKRQYVTRESKYKY